MRLWPLLLALAACSRPAPDSTPDGVVRLWLERMETSTEDAHAMRDAYALLGPVARANLEERAQRASRVQGSRVEPYQMLAEGRFGLKFRPKAMSVTAQGAQGAQGDRATVDVVGADPATDRAVVHCTREGSVWRIEPELPEIAIPVRRSDGGLP